MHQRAKTFVERAEERYGFSPDVTEFSEGTKTAADAAEAIGCDVAQIASSIVLSVTGASETERADGSAVDDGEPVVVVTSGANRVDTEKVAALLDAKHASMADADAVKAATGWSIGGVPPICHDSAVRVLMDETLLDYDTVWAAAGTPTSVFPVDPERLRELADAEVADVAE